MTVARILDEKGRDVFTTQPHRTLKEVIDLLPKGAWERWLYRTLRSAFWAYFQNATSSASSPNMAPPRWMILCRVT